MSMVKMEFAAAQSYIGFLMCVLHFGEALENYVHLGCMFTSLDSGFVLPADENTIPSCSDRCKQTYYTYFIVWGQGNNRQCACVGTLPIPFSADSDCEQLCGPYPCGSGLLDQASVYAVCERGYHGLNCDLLCHCANDAICGRSSTGGCPQGCDPGWTGDRCDQPQLQQGKSSTRSPFTGQENYVHLGCMFTSHEGVVLPADENTIPSCYDRCKQTYYTYFIVWGQDNRKCACVGTLPYPFSADSDCEQLCGPYPCGSGLLDQASVYAVCERGYHGMNCDLPCHCANDAICGRSSTGGCPQGCDPGWAGDRCDQPQLQQITSPTTSPSNGQATYNYVGCFYTASSSPDLRLPADENTIPRCYEHCKQTAYTFYLVKNDYRDTTRSCTCSDALFGDYQFEGSRGSCDTLCGEHKCGSSQLSTIYSSAYAVCDNGYYGANCADRCHCAGGAICSRSSNGQCPGGCMPGWTGNHCNQVEGNVIGSTNNGNVTPSIESEGISNTLIIAIVVPVAVIIVTVISAVLCHVFLRKKIALCFLRQAHEAHEWGARHTPVVQNIQKNEGKNDIPLSDGQYLHTSINQPNGNPPNANGNNGDPLSDGQYLQTSDTPRNENLPYANGNNADGGVNNPTTDYPETGIYTYITDVAD